MTAQDALQRAVYARLNGNATANSATIPIYDEAPQGTPFPYITIGEFNPVPFNVHGSVGRNATFNIHVWSRHNGNEEANQIADAVDDLLDLKPGSLNVSGWSVVSLELLDAKQIGSPDGITRHLVMRYRARIE